MDVSVTGNGGAEVTAPVSDNSQVQTPAAAPAEPSVIELKDDILVKDPKTGQPVKYGEYNRGFQSQFTKVSQRAAQLQRELEQERQARQRYEDERQRAAQAQQQGQQPDIYSKLRELPYLTGEEAVGALQSIKQDITQRDYILAATLKELQGLKQIVTGLNESSTSAAFESKIGKYLNDAGYDSNHQGLRKLASEIYLAYEGDDLDIEFPNIFAERMREVEEFFNARRASALRQAKGTPFLPGRGGQANPSRPLQLDPRASARDTADQLWETLQGSGT